MDCVTVKDKQFRLSIPAARIAAAVEREAARINADYEGQEPLFIAVLNGSFMFAADLMRHITVPSEIAFVKLSSYEGMDTTGRVRELIGLSQSIEGRPVVIVEDIVDTGITMSHLLAQLQRQHPASLEVCTLLMKPDKLEADIRVKYCALEIPNDFIVGYGLDYDGYGRGLADIYTVVD